MYIYFIFIGNCSVIMMEFLYDVLLLFYALCEYFTYKEIKMLTFIRKVNQEKSFNLNHYVKMEIKICTFFRYMFDKKITSMSYNMKQLGARSQILHIFSANV